MLSVCRVYLVEAARRALRELQDSTVCTWVLLNKVFKILDVRTGRTNIEGILLQVEKIQLLVGLRCIVPLVEFVNVPLPAKDSMVFETLIGMLFLLFLSPAKRLDGWVQYARS